MMMKNHRQTFKIKTAQLFDSCRFQIIHVRCASYDIRDNFAFPERF